MKINIIAIGKFRKNCPNQELFLDYSKRLKWPLNLIQIDSKIVGSTDEIKQKEGELILKNLPENSKVILLDEKGENLTSREFAAKIAKFQNNSQSNLSFIIGGANGISDQIKKIANLSIAFGKMTFPHMMVRSMLIEQIYRANLIINNHPYHKD